MMAEAGARPARSRTMASASALRFIIDPETSSIRSIRRTGRRKDSSIAPLAVRAETSRPGAAASARRRRGLRRAARRRPGDLGKVVLEHHEGLPFVAVGVVDPGLVLRGVAAVGLHLVAGDEARLGPARTDGEDVGGGGDLQAEVRGRAP